MCEEFGNNFKIKVEISKHLHFGSWADRALLQKNVLPCGFFVCLRRRAQGFVET